MNEYSLILTILNRGFSDLVMDSARQSGAKGGTIITARGTGSKVAEKLFGITLSQEREIILILASNDSKNEIMSSICKSAGLNTEGKGIAFSLPVDDVLGIALGINDFSLSDKNAAAHKENSQTSNVTISEKSVNDDHIAENPEN